MLLAMRGESLQCRGSGAALMEACSCRGGASQGPTDAKKSVRVATCGSAFQVVPIETCGSTQGLHALATTSTTAAPVDSTGHCVKACRAPAARARGERCALLADFASGPL
jgi:hypothetical protein